MDEEIVRQHNEKDLVIFRQSRDRLYLDLGIVLLSFIGLSIMFLVSALFPPIIILIIFAIAVFVGAVIYLTWYYTIYTITSIRIEYKSGIISKVEEEICLEDIQTVDAMQSLIGRLLNHGDIKIESAGNNIIVLKNVHNAHHLAHQIATLSLHYNKDVELKEDQTPFDQR
jgi:uncharacterized membrane protein YdbT with pleckstrin-like domain